MKEKNQLSPDESNLIHYVIVVPGIGQQRKNETVLLVIKQFGVTFPDYLRPLQNIITREEDFK